MKKFDPFYIALRYFVLAHFFKTKLLKPELEFLEENLAKHKKILWISSFISIFNFFGLINYQGSKATIISALIAPVTVTGVAWFAISFGGISSKLIEIAMSVTSWMFTAFIISFATMMMSVCFVTPFYFWPAIIIIFVSTIICCIQYDSADGLKAGLDEALLNHSRAALLYYRKNGIIGNDE